MSEAKEPYSRFISDDEDEYEVYDLSDLDIVKPEKSVTASAINNFKIVDDSEEDEQL